MLRGAFVERPNRFVLRARLDDGEVVDAYLPNTSRLTELLEPGREILLEPVDDPDRKTDYTVRRFWDGTWVSVEATAAESLLEGRLAETGRLPGIGEIDDWSSQVEHRGHRFDYLLRRPGDGEIWLEVKSLSRCFGSDAVLSGTPSRRGVAHLEALADMAEEGLSAALAFVVQRDDAERLVVGQPAIEGEVDEDWIDAVRGARRRGVTILAYGCDITTEGGRLARRLPVLDLDDDEPRNSRETKD